MKVLIVDDDTIVVESCCRILHAEDIATQTAGTVEEAKVILEADIFDVMITDIKMPKEDGFQLISWIKQQLPEMVVLMMTGYLTPDIQNKGLSSGADGFIAKPFTPNELLEQLEKSLEKKNNS